MQKELCLIHANCQGDPLADLLGMHAEFSGRYAIKTFVNFTRDHVPAEDMSRCTLFLYQWLGSAWGPLSSREMLKLLPPGARSICIPNLFFKAYWPLWETNKSFDYSDMLLNDLIGRGLNKTEILHLYLHTDINKYYDLQELINISISREEKKQEHWDIKMLDRIMEEYAREPLFKTVNHPGKKLCIELADAVLTLLDMPLLEPEQRNAFKEPFPEFEQPIHPRVVDYLGLSFVQPDTRYFVYGDYKTFEEYTNCYVDCRLLGIDDFIGFLRLDCGRREIPWKPEE